MYVPTSPFSPQHMHSRNYCNNQLHLGFWLAILKAKQDFAQEEGRSCQSLRNGQANYGPLSGSKVGCCEHLNDLSCVLQIWVVHLYRSLQHAHNMLHNYVSNCPLGRSSDNSFLIPMPRSLFCLATSAWVQLPQHNLLRVLGRL